MNVGKQMRSGAAMGIYSELISDAVRSRAKDFFSFGLDYLPLAASGTATQAFTVDSDSDFMLCALTAISSANGAPQTQVAFIHATATLADTGSGRLFQSTALHLMAYFGTAQLPAFLPYPKMIPRASTVRCTLQNLVATAIDVRLGFHGFKIFPMPDH